MPSTVRAQLPAMRMILGEFGLPENRCAGSQKNARRKTPRIQSALSVSRTRITKSSNDNQGDLGRV